MTGAGGQEHWFDRLAAPQTRRQAFKAALAGVALTLPFARATPALADDPHACQKGCIYAAHQRGVKDLNACGGGVAYNFASGFFSVGLGFFSAFGAGRVDVLRRQSCVDRALMQSKATGYDCLQSNCPGFDPRAAGGPCETCTPDVGSCCPDQLVTSGYSCCTLGCACAGEVGACHGSTTPC